MEDKFWLVIWKFLIVCFMFISLGIVSCNIHIDYKIGEAIANGADPIEARLAFSNVTTASEMAIVKLLNKKGS